MLYLRCADVDQCHTAVGAFLLGTHALLSIVTLASSICCNVMISVCHVVTLVVNAHLHEYMSLKSSADFDFIYIVFYTLPK